MSDNNPIIIFDSSTDDNKDNNKDNNKDDNKKIIKNQPPLRSMVRTNTTIGQSIARSKESENLMRLPSLGRRKKTVSFKADTVKIIDVDCWKKYNVDVSEADGNVWKKGKLLQQFTEEAEMERKEKEAEEKKKKETESCCSDCLVF